MAINWRELLPHYAAMIVIYSVFVILLDILFGVNTFLSSLAIAFVVAFGYPQVVRQLGYAPPSWKR